MTSPSKPTLKDVAELAGVSLGSASRVLSTPEAVKPATRRKVEDAVRQLGYLRNGAARALAMRRTHSVGAVFPTFNNPIFADTIQALQQRLYDRNYQLLIVSHEYDQARELAAVRNLIERGVEGLLLVGTEHDAGVFETLKASARPYILLWSLDDCTDQYCVGFHNQEGGAITARHLLELGHTRFAVISGEYRYNERMRHRIEGIRKELNAAGVDLPASHIVEQALSLDGGRAGLKQVMGLDPKPTALVCLTDILSIGANAEARIMGVRVPGDLSISGIDDSGFSAVTHPALTSIHVPTEDIGRRSADNIISLIEGRTVPKQERVEIELIVRASTAPPAGHEEA